MISNKTHLILILPALLLSMAVIFVPACLTIASSFTDWNGISLTSTTFVGFSNFLELFSDSVFLKAFSNNLRWMLWFSTIPVVIALLVSYFLIKALKLRGIMQAIYLFPYVLSPMVNSVLWLNIIYSPISGILGILNRLGLPLASPLSSVKTALFGVAIVDIWHYTGFLVVVYFSALRQTPDDQVEAALIEGCSQTQLFRHVYFPNILPTFKLMLVMIWINSILSFNYVYMLTGGGPAQSSELMGTLAYKYAFSMFKFGKSSAVAVIMALVGLVFSSIYVRMTKREQ